MYNNGLHTEIKRSRQETSEKYGFKSHTKFIMYV